MDEADLKNFDINDIDKLRKFLDTSVDYYTLKNEAIEYIKKFGGKLWNDYTEHDPGITILEELCYALVDIDYRLSFNIEDLLMEKAIPETIKFHEAHEILSCSPITINDYKKLILDIDEVRNCDVIPLQSPDSIKGMYKVYLCIDSDDNNKIQNQVINKVRNTLYKYRNLCEDFVSVEMFDVVDVAIDMTLVPDIDSVTANNYDVYAANLLVYIQNIFTPSIKFHSIIDLNTTYNMALNEIYDGPLLSYGFIRNEDLDEFSLKKNFYIFNIISQVVKFKRIKSVINFSIRNTETNIVYDNVINLKNNQIIRLNFKQSNINLIHNSIKISLNIENVLSIAKRYNFALSRKHNKNEYELGIYDGKYRDLSSYSSIQNELPAVYGVGIDSFKETSSTKEEVNQLKGYLMFFDIYMSQYLKDIDNLKFYMAVANKHDIINDQLPTDVSNIKQILKKPSTEVSRTDPDYGFYIQKKLLGLNFNNDTSEKVIDSCKKYINEVNAVMKTGFQKKIIDFIFSKYSEKIHDDNHVFRNTNMNKKEYLRKYGIIGRAKMRANIHSNNSTEFESNSSSGFEIKLKYYWNIKNTKRRLLHLSMKNNFFLWRGLDQQDIKLAETNISGKILFNGKYPRLTYLVLLYGDEEKNYTIINCQENDKDNQYKILLYIDENKIHYISISVQDGLKTYEKASTIVKQLVKYIKKYNRDSEGFHFIEHILLYNNEKVSKTYDPYSFQISIIFPDWPKRFQNPDFRKLMTHWIALEAPSHIKFNILWLTPKQMEVLEYHYKYWYELKYAEDKDWSEIDKAAKTLLSLLGKKYE